MACTCKLFHLIHLVGDVTSEDIHHSTLYMYLVFDTKKLGLASFVFFSLYAYMKEEPLTYNFGYTNESG